MKTIAIRSSARVPAADHPGLRPTQEALLPKASRIAENSAYNDAFAILDERFLNVGDLLGIELVEEQMFGEGRRAVLHARFVMTFAVRERELVRGE